MTTDVTLNGVALSTAVPSAIVTRPERPLVGSRRDVFVDVPGRAGSWKFAEEPGDRIIELAVDILAETFEARRSAVRALADWCAVGAASNLIIDDEPDRYHVGILDNDPDPDEWLNHAGSIRLRFRCDPYALATALSSETVAVSGGGSDSGTFNVDDVLDAEPIIEITPNDGTITGFTLTVNGYAISYTAPTIASGNTVTISSISDTVTAGTNGDTMLTGAYNPASVTMGFVTANLFPLLVNGTNAWSLTWDGTATDITAEITWRERFR